MTIASTLADHLKGDGPCQDCGTVDNICWFTDSPFWNQVMGGPLAMGDPGGILCIPCFVERADNAGFEPTGWRLTPEWRWTTRAADHHARLAACDHPRGFGTICDVCGGDVAAPMPARLAAGTEEG